MNSEQHNALLKAGTLIRNFLKPLILKDRDNYSNPKIGASHTTGYCEAVSYFTSRLLGHDWDYEVGIVERSQIPAREHFDEDTIRKSDEAECKGDYRFVDKYGVGYLDYSKEVDEYGNEYMEPFDRAEGHTWLINYREDLFLDLTADQFGMEPVLIMDMEQKKARGYSALCEQEVGSQHDLMELLYQDLVESWEADAGYQDLKEQVLALMPSWEPESASALPF